MFKKFIFASIITSFSFSNDYSLSFDGQNDYVTIPGSELYDNLGDFSFSVWIKIPEALSVLNGNQFVINKDHYPSYGNASYSLRFQNGGDGLPEGVESLAWFFDPDGNSGDNNAILHTELSNLTDNQWHYITCTRNQATGELKLYVDGDVVSSATTITNTIISPNAFVLGSHVWTDRSFYEGSIDNFNFWNKDLSQSEIQFTMNNGLSGDEEGLVGYWNFNEGNGNVLTDLSSNGNDGTIYGAIWSDDVPSSGCTDPYAENYNADAEFDDGSCEYLQNEGFALNFGTDDHVVIESQVTYQPQSLNVNTRVKIFDLEYTGDTDRKIAGECVGGCWDIVYNYNDNTIWFGVKVSSTWYRVYSPNPMIFDEYIDLEGVYNKADNYLALYVNGQMVVSRNDVPNGELFEYNFPLTIMGNTAGAGLGGSVDHLEIIQDGTQVGEWQFNEGEGELVFDHSGNQNHGTIIGASWEEVVSGCTDPYAENYNTDANVDDGSCSGYPDNGSYSLSFDGVDDIVSLTKSGPTGNSARSIYFRLKINNFDTPNGILNYGNNEYGAWGQRIQIEVNTDGDLVLDNNGSWAKFSGVVTDNSFHDYILILQEGDLLNQFILYRDGVLYNIDDVGGQVSQTTNTTNHPLEFGFIFPGPGFEAYLNGSLDRVQIWDAALTYEDVQMHMQNLSDFYEYGLVGNWKFNSGSGNILYDHSGNQNHGTIIGATWEEVVSGCTDPYAENYNADANIDDGSCVYPENGDYSLMFDGQDDYVSLPNTALNIIGQEENSATLILEYKGTGAFFEGARWNPNNPILFRVEAVNSSNGVSSIKTYHRNTDGSFSAEPATDMVSFDDEFNRIIISFDNINGTYRLFLNGEKLIDYEFPPSSFAHNEMLWGIGKHFGGGPNWLEGNISNIKVLKEAMTDADVIEYYNGEFEIVDYYANWKFNAGEGNVLYDHSGNQNHGTIFGATWSSDVPISGCTDEYAENYNEDVHLDDNSCVYPDNGNYALSFDGIDDFVSVEYFDLLTNQNDVTNDFTLDILFKKSISINEFDGMNIISFGSGISDGKRLSLFIDLGNRLRIPLQNNDWETNYIITDNQWTNITLTYQKIDGLLKVFHNGMLIDQISEFFISVDNNFPMMVGKNTQNRDDEFFHGEIDYVSIWNYKFSDEEVLELSGQSIDLFNPQLKGYFKFNSGEGDILYDHSGNQNHGTIFGADWEIRNTPPSDFEILSPDNNLTLQIDATNLDEQIELSWTESEDADGSAVEYVITFEDETGEIWDELPGNTVKNGDFEDWSDMYYFDENGDEYGIEIVDNWEHWPLVDYDVVGGDFLFYYEMDGFEIEDGYHSGFGFHINSEVLDYLNTPEWPGVSIYQAFSEVNGNFIEPGTNVSISTDVNIHFLENADFALKIGFFDDGYNWIGSEEVLIQNDDNYPYGNWSHLEVDAEVPFGTSIVNVGFELFSTGSNPEGEAIIDNFYCHIPHRGTNLSVSKESILEISHNMGEEQLLWNVAAIDEYSFTMAEESPRVLNLDIEQGIVKFTVHDTYQNLQDVRMKTSAFDWVLFPMNDDGVDGDEVAGDFIWTAILEDVPPGEHEWGAIDTWNGPEWSSWGQDRCDMCDGSDGWGIWLLNTNPNLEYVLDDNGVTFSGDLDLTVEENQIFWSLEEFQISSYPFEMMEDEPDTLMIQLSNPSEDNLVLSSGSDTTGMMVEIIEHEMSFHLLLSPVPNWNGDAHIYVSAADDLGNVDTVHMSVYVESVDDPPVIVDIPDQETDEDTPLKVELDVYDVDGDYVNVQLRDDILYNTDGYVIANGDSILLVPHPDWHGTETVQVVAQSGIQEVFSSFTLTVNPVDDDPFVDGYIQDLYFYEDFQEPWSRNLDSVFLDIDDELDLVYSVSFSEGDVILGEIAEDTFLTLQAYPDGEGEVAMYVTASNPTRASVTDTVLITVFGENDAPVVADMEPLVMVEDTPYEFMSMESLVEAGHISDVDNTLEELTFHLHSETEQVHVDWDGDASSTPMIHTELDYYGPGSLTLCVADEYEETCTTIGLNVDPVNDAPYFPSEMNASVGMDIEFHLPLDLMDVDSEELVVTLDAAETNPAWVMVTDNALHGTPDMLGEYHIYLTLSDGQTAVEDTFHLNVVNFKPEIVAVDDIPNDQGGRVYVNFHGSFMDNGLEIGQSYSVFRWDAIGEEEGWVGVQSLDAIGEPNYVYEVSTVHDSSEGNNALTQFKVVANMNNGIFHSDPVVGYSVDNIAPGVPGGLMAVAMDDNIQLSWDRCADEDFQYFVLEKATNMDFTEPEVIQTADTSYTDVNFTANETNYYRLVAVDHAGNTSDYSEAVEAAVLSIDENMVPAEFALHQNYPNPFNPTTQIKYDIAEDSFVRITIFDVMGRNIRTLMNVNQNAGYHSIHWDAKNDIGEGVSAGMYIYVIQAGEFRATKKMVLLK